MGAGASASRGTTQRSSSRAQTGGENRPDSSSLALTAANVAGMTKLIEAKNKFLKNSNKEKPLHKKQLDSNALLRELFKRMDPTVSQGMDNGEIKGSVELSFKYNYKDELLLVKVIRASELIAKDLGGTSDPYVAVDLFPDRSGEGVKKSGFKIKTLNPQFNEIFTFSLEESKLDQTKLRVHIWDHDFFGKDDFMGEVLLKLNSIDLNGEHADWYSLQPQTDLSISGELDISLDYEEPETLIVTVHSARDLSPSGTVTKSIDAYVRCRISGIQQLEQTQVISGSENPEWEESFEFIVPREEFQSRIIKLYVFDKQTAGRDKRLGDVNIPLKDFDIEVTMRRWHKLADLKNISHRRSDWAVSAVAQEFREAMYAHALYKAPSFMFQDDPKKKYNKGRTTKKVYTVSNRNAGTVAKVHLVNGVPVS